MLLNMCSIAFSYLEFGQHTCSGIQTPVFKDGCVFFLCVLQTPVGIGVSEFRFCPWQTQKDMTRVLRPCRHRGLYFSFGSRPRVRWAARDAAGMAEIYLPEMLPASQPDMLPSRHASRKSKDTKRWQGTLARQVHVNAFQTFPTSIMF